MGHPRFDIHDMLNFKVNFFRLFPGVASYHLNVVQMIAKAKPGVFFRDFP